MKNTKEKSEAEEREEIKNLLIRAGVITEKEKTDRIRI
jgi:hypothetical protein